MRHRMIYSQHLVARDRWDFTAMKLVFLCTRMQIRAIENTNMTSPDGVKPNLSCSRTTIMILPM